jgi:cyclopropane-fatty-acyl-phospholipid synthase
MGDSLREEVSRVAIQSNAIREPRVAAQWYRRRVHAHLSSLRKGAVALVDGPERHEFGARDAELRATLYVGDRRFYRRVALGGAIAAAESYMDGDWRSDDLPSLLRIFATNAAAHERLDGGAARWRRLTLRGLHALRRNTRAGSRRNIAAHYDHSVSFFELFLDPTLTYSSGVFERPEATMEEASRAKYERVCRKLGLGPNHHVLEIGTGWGGFALHAATRYGCRVTTTTISREQYEYARERVQREGLAGRVEVMQRDYRDLTGRYDRLVAIEMIEAVGHRNLDAFMRRCSERLAPQGSLLLQAITVPDQDFAAHTRSVDFIKRYIFPGGELVSVAAVHESARRASDLRIVHVEDLTPHYAETLRHWRRRFLENLPRMRALGLDDRFLRTWEFYLAYCEAGFAERTTGLVQIVYGKPRTLYGTS